MSFRNIFAESCILPASDFINSQVVHKSYMLLMRSQFWSKSKLIDYQSRRLQTLIKHIYSSVPYYQGVMKGLGIRPDDIQQLSDLQQLPFLTKSIIKQEGIQRFTSTKVPPRLIMPQSSSGSTGEPLFFSTTKDAYSMNIAANLRGWYWMGYRLGDRFVKLSQNPRKAILKRMQDYFSNNLYLATDPLTNENFEYILNKIEKYKPKIIRCYPDPLLMLARYKKEHKGFNFTPMAITTTGNTLYPETRNEIEDAFKCKIFDSYSCEGNSTVFECLTHTGYHSAEEYGISEVVDEAGKRITQGIGRLISTDLWNLSHPFIRYDTQDLVEIDPEPCICGRAHLKYKRILGRDNDIIISPNGRYFIVHNFTAFFQVDNPYINRSVDQFQVIKQKDRVLFNLVVNKKYNNVAEDYIINYWQNEFGCQVTIELLENIPLLKSGKRKFIINEAGL